MANAHRDAAERDELTGVLNRRGIQKHGARLLEQSLARGEVVTAMFIDLDHFKQVNDVHGHDTGDEVLRTAAQLIMEEVRPNDLVCRWGGDEFLVVLRCVAGLSAQSVAKRIRSAFQPLMEEYRIGLSMGLVDSSYRGLDEVNLDSLVREADVCLYRCKKSGRNKTVVAI
jgi:diguanylate cyclase (GGDEF)-like protein